jgi:hypothetical protein
MTLDLFAFRKNYYSQNGEDGIIEKVLAEIGLDNGFFVEFGAWDGKHWSNTYNLIDKKKWTGCLIEGDTGKYEELCQNIPNDDIIKVRAWIRPTGEDSLDEILRRNGVDHVDLLSIDIDSDDLAIWEGVAFYSPTIVIIEFNPTIPFDTRYKNPPGAFHGNSALAIFELAAQRCYALVAGTDTNLIFVKNDALKESRIPPRTLQDVRDNTFQLRYFFSQDGRLLHTYDVFTKAGVTELFPVPWAFTLGTQPVPKFLRNRSDKIGFFIVAFSLLVAIVRCPLQLLKLATYMVRSVTKGKSYAEVFALVTKKDKLTTLLIAEAGLKPHHGSGRNDQ